MSPNITYETDHLCIKKKKYSHLTVRKGQLYIDFVQIK